MAAFFFVKSWFPDQFKVLTHWYQNSINHMNNYNYNYNNNNMNFDNHYPSSHINYSNHRDFNINGVSSSRALKPYNCRCMSPTFKSQVLEEANIGRLQDSNLIYNRELNKRNKHRFFEERPLSCSPCQYSHGERVLASSINRGKNNYAYSRPYKNLNYGRAYFNGNRSSSFDKYLSNENSQYYNSNQIPASARYTSVSLIQKSNLYDPSGQNLSLIQGSSQFNPDHNSIKSLAKTKRNILNYLYSIFLGAVHYAEAQRTNCLPVFTEILKDLKYLSGPILFELVRSAISLKSNLGIRDTILPERIDEMQTYELFHGKMRHSLIKFAHSAIKFIEKRMPGCAEEVPIFIFRLFSVLYKCTSRNGTLCISEEFRNAVEDLLIRGLQVYLKHFSASAKEVQVGFPYSRHIFCKYPFLNQIILNLKV